MGDPPPHAERRERAPASVRSQPGRPVAPDRPAQVVTLREVVVHLAEERQQRGLGAPAVHVLGLRITDRVLDVPRVDVGRDQVVQAGTVELVGAPVGFLAEQHVEVVPPTQDRGVVERIGPGPIPEGLVVLGDAVGQ